MPLWGNKDSKTATGTIETELTLVTGTGTSFTTEAKAGDYLSAGGFEFRIVSIANDTSCVISGPSTTNAAANIAAGNAYTLSEKPVYITASENANSELVFGVDTTEVGLTAGVAHAGWVRRTVGSGNRTGRVQHEVLVAGSSITGDAGDDTEYPDS